MTDHHHFPPGPTPGWTCDHVRDELEAWALGTLAPAETSAIEQHLGDCDACRLEAERLREVASLLPFALPPVEPSPETKQALMTRVAHEQRHNSATRNLTSRTSRPTQQELNQVPRRPVSWSQALIAPLAIALLVMTLWAFDLRGQVADLSNSGTTADTGTTTAILPAGVQTYSLTKECQQCDSEGKLLADPDESNALFVAWNLDPEQVHYVWCEEGDGSKVMVSSLEISPAGDVVQPLAFDQPIAGYSKIYVTSRKNDDEQMMMGVSDEEMASPTPQPIGQQ